MDLTWACKQMRDNAEAIRALVSGCPAEEAAWKPSETLWSIVEVVNHLLDEEREDFRRRVDVVLHRRDVVRLESDRRG